MFSIKDISKDLGITVQAIYNKKEFLKERGFLYKNSLGLWEINAEGYNYLKDSQLKKFNKPIENETGNTSNINNNEELNILKEQLNLYKKEIEEWKNRYDTKDKEYTDFRNNQQLLLQATEEERKKYNERAEMLIRENSEIKSEYKAYQERVKNTSLINRILKKF